MARVAALVAAGAALMVLGSLNGAWVFDDPYALNWGVVMTSIGSVLLMIALERAQRLRRRKQR